MPEQSTSIAGTFDEQCWRSVEEIAGPEKGVLRAMSLERFLCSLTPVSFGCQMSANPSENAIREFAPG